MSVDKTEVEEIKKMVHDVLASRELEAAVVIRDRKTKEVLYETGMTNVVVGNVITFRHIIGDVEVTQT